MTPQHEKLEQILDLVEGRLSSDDARRLTAEIQADAQLGDLHEWARDFRSMAQRTTFVAAPESTHTMLAGLLPDRRATGSTVGQLVDIVARLIRDVSAGPRFAGARGAALDSKRHLLFGTGTGTDLTIELEIVDAALHISGQLLADDPSAVVTLSSDESTTQFETDGDGEFSSTITLPTSVQLSLTTASQRIYLDLTPYLDPAGSAPHGTT